MNIENFKEYIKEVLEEKKVGEIPAPTKKPMVVTARPPTPAEEKEEEPEEEEPTADDWQNLMGDPGVYGMMARGELDPADPEPEPARRRKKKRKKITPSKKRKARVKKKVTVEPEKKGTEDDSWADDEGVVEPSPWTDESIWPGPKPTITVERDTRGEYLAIRGKPTKEHPGGYIKWGGTLWPFKDTLRGMGYGSWKEYYLENKRIWDDPTGPKFKPFHLFFALDEFHSGLRERGTIASQEGGEEIWSWKELPAGQVKDYIQGNLDPIADDYYGVPIRVLYQNLLKLYDQGEATNIILTFKKVRNDLKNKFQQAARLEYPNRSTVDKIVDKYAGGYKELIPITGGKSGPDILLLPTNGKYFTDAERKLADRLGVVISEE